MTNPEEQKVDSDSELHKKARKTDSEKSNSQKSDIELASLVKSIKKNVARKKNKL